MPSQLVERAIQVYEKAGWFGDAAEVALKAGDSERAGVLRELEKLIKE